MRASGPTPQTGTNECHACRQVRNFSPTRWMFVNDSTGTWATTNTSGQRASSMLFASNPAKNNTANAGYVNDPFGYQRLAPVNPLGGLLQPGANSALSLGASSAPTSGTGCMPPMTAYSIDVSKAPVDPASTFAALEGPMNTSTWGPARVVTLRATNDSNKCSRNIGTQQTNQGGDSAQSDNLDWRNFYYGASDTNGWDSGGGWQSAADLIALAPHTGAAFWGVQHIDSSPNWGCTNGCHDNTWGCSPFS